MHPFVNGFGIMTLKVHQVCGIAYDSNVYFVETAKPILIDTGTGYYVKKTLKNLEKIRTPVKIDRIILTHNHADHSGGVAELSDTLGAEVFAHELDGKALVDGNASATGATMFGREQPKVDVTFLEHGETVDCGDVELEVLHTPGHSPGSISLYDAGTRSLFCGDLVFMDGGVGRWDLAGGDYKELVKSYDKIMKLDIDNFYPGHGPSNEGEAMKYIELSYRYLRSCSSFID